METPFNPDLTGNESYCQLFINNMNITESIAKEMGADVEKILKSTPEIQIYANTNIHKYQWRDGRFRDTCDVWKNESFDTRLETRSKIKEYLQSRSDL